MISEIKELKALKEEINGLKFSYSAINKLKYILLALCNIIESSFNTANPETVQFKKPSDKP